MLTFAYTMPDKFYKHFILEILKNYSKTERINI